MSLTSEQVAHLGMIQNVITRMAGNSFALKTLSVTLVTAVIALIGAIDDPQPLYIAAAGLPVVVFWWMDAKYLQLERLYRALYDDVRNGAAVAPFDMRANQYLAQTQSVPRIAFSWSVVAIYLTLLCVLILVGYALYPAVTAGT